MSSSNLLAQIFGTDRLTESNHNDWLQNLRLDLSSKKLTHVLNQDEPFEGTFDLLIIETNLTIFSSSCWVLNFGSSAHLCTSMQKLEEVRGLREGEITLQLDNGKRVAAVTVGIYHLQLSLGFSLLLKDCFYVPVTSRNLISISMLL